MGDIKRFSKDSTKSDGNKQYWRDGIINTYNVRRLTRSCVVVGNGIRNQD